MARDDRQPAAYDEQAVLDQLEQLQQQIEDVRRKRREATDAFDSFVRSFRSGQADAQPATSTQSDAPPPYVRAHHRPDDFANTDRPAELKASIPEAEAPPTHARTHHRSDEFTGTGRVAEVRPPARPEPLSTGEGHHRQAVDDLRGHLAELPDIGANASEYPAPASDADVHAIPEAWRTDPPAPAHRAHPVEPTLPAADVPASPLEAASRRASEATMPVVPAALSAPPRRQHRSLVLVLAVVAALVLAAAAWQMQPVTDDAPPPAASSEPAPVSPPVVPAPVPTTAPPTPAVAAPPPAAELRTTRPVWVRVTVDGQKVIERELAADVRIPLEPKQDLVIRAGDGGALRVSIAGADQGVLGEDGLVVTKRFTVGQ